jgi:peptide/nickel transport system substrate-binding protein
MRRSLSRRVIALLLAPALALAAAGCRPQPEGTIKAVVIGGKPTLRDPAAGPLTAPDSVLLGNVAQGLVRFDASGNIVSGLAERWNVSDDGLSYIFRLASTEWPDHRKITAQQVARLIKRQIASRSKNSLKDALGAVDDVVAMTDRVIEIRLIAPRPNLLPLLAQPELAILSNGAGTGPFSYNPSSGGGALRLTRQITIGDEEVSRRQEVLLAASPAQAAIQEFASGNSDLVLGGTFSDLPYLHSVKLARGMLRFDPASGLFGLIPLRNEGRFADPASRRLLSQAIDRDAVIAALGVPNLAPRGTLLEAGLDGVAAPVAPAWTATPLGTRLPGLQAEAKRRFAKIASRTVRILLPSGPGADLLLRQLALDWGALGLAVERASSAANADFALIDEVAPSASAAWFARRFRCAVATVCDPDADQLLDAARLAPVPAQRYALLAQAASRIDDEQLFIPITAPVRWSLVSRRVQNFAGNRYARHTLTDLELKPGSE